MNSCNCIEYNTEHGALFTFTYNLCTLYVYISMYSYLKKKYSKECDGISDSRTKPNEPAKSYKWKKEWWWSCDDEEKEEENAKQYIYFIKWMKLWLFILLHAHIFYIIVIHFLLLYFSIYFCFASSVYTRCGASYTVIVSCEMSFLFFLLNIDFIDSLSLSNDIKLLSPSRNHRNRMIRSRVCSTALFNLFNQLFLVRFYNGVDRLSKNIDPNRCAKLPKCFLEPSILVGTTHYISPCNISPWVIYTSVYGAVCVTLRFKRCCATHSQLIQLYATFAATNRQRMYDIWVKEQYIFVYPQQQQKNKKRCYRKK